MDQIDGLYNKVTVIEQVFQDDGILLFRSSVVYVKYHSDILGAKIYCTYCE